MPTRAHGVEPRLGPGLARAYGAVRDALRAALCMAGDELARLACSGRADDGMTDEERRDAADEAGREVDFHI